MKFSIYRYNPDVDAKPRMQDYDIALEATDRMLLDALIRIKEQDDTLSLRRLQAVTSSDWGWYTTFTDNLGSVRSATPELLAAEDSQAVLARIDRLRAGLDESPKSMRWRARSVIGRKTPWYELPEEVDRGGVR